MLEGLGPQREGQRLLPMHQNPGGGMARPSRGGGGKELDPLRFCLKTFALSLRVWLLMGLPQGESSVNAASLSRNLHPRL